MVRLYYVVPTLNKKDSTSVTKVVRHPIVIRAPTSAAALTTPAAAASPAALTVRTLTFALFPPLFS